MKIKKYNNGGTVKLQTAGKVPEAVVTARAPSINTKQGKIAAKNMASRLLSGQDNTGRVPSSYYNYVTGELNGAVPTRQAINNASKELLPYVLGAAFGPAGAVATITGEVINTGVNAATKGNKDSGGDLFVNEEKHPIGNTVMDFTNPGYLLVGRQPRPSRASDAGVAMLRGESAKKFLEDAAKVGGERIETKNLSDSPVVQNILAGKIGGAPRTAETLYHHSNTPLSELDPMFKSGDVVERSAPRGKVGLTEDSGTAGFLAERPYHQTAEVTLTKPMVQVGEAIGNGKNAVRNDIVRFAQDAGADGIQFKEIADNQLTNQNITTSFKPERLKRIIVPGSRPISEAERLGIPKGMRSNPKALEDPYYGGYKQWNQRYNKAVEVGNIEEAQRLRDLHFKIKTPDNKIVDYKGSPHKVYHGSPEDGYIFDDSKRGVDDVIYFSTDKAYADQYTIPRNQWQKGMIPTRSSRAFYLYGKEPIKVGSDMYYGSVQDELIHNWANGLNADSVYGLDAITNPLNPSSGMEFGVLRRNQFKSANPITKTDTGEIIPIIKRDNFRNPDIRYKRGGKVNK